MAARKGRPPVGSSQHGVPAGSPRPAAAAAPADRARETPPFTRPALAPSLIAAIVLLSCVAIVDSSGFVFARWGVTVLALIVLVFAIRGRTWWAALLMAAVAVCWNPLVTVPIPGQVWAGLQLVAAALFIVVGIVVKVPRETDAPRAS
ncbi:DUF6804 family protein [Curtobacterium aurantiacum]|uniref:DUF6804 family protein n=1 Tax=Curtobacterium aurantiacum TaxID=3236919 RepID=UPI001BDFE16D|nr:DUF6804 family protein [Curtobacterium flaccumfaciens]MBT1676612.1 hypothetical protein [Curtobacterium flaccumfaciens pv. flaccumfaciens]